MNYKYGEPDKYGDFPYLYAGRYKDEELNAILLERLPKHYNMGLTDPDEELVIAHCSQLGIDEHLEAMTQNSKDCVEDRKIGDRVVMQYHAFDFTPTGMVCLIRRLQDYSPDNFGVTEDERKCELYDAAYNLRSCILETLQIESV